MHRLRLVAFLALLIASAAAASGKITVDVEEESGGLFSTIGGYAQDFWAYANDHALVACALILGVGFTLYLYGKYILGMLSSTWMWFRGYLPAVVYVVPSASGSGYQTADGQPISFPPPKKTK